MQTSLDLSTVKSAVKGESNASSDMSEDSPAVVIPNDNRHSLRKIEQLNCTIKVLEQQNQLYRELLDMNDDAVFVKKKNGRVAYANQTVCDQYPDKAHASLVDENIDSRFSKKQAEQFRQSDKIALSEGFFESTEHITLPDEAEIIAKVTKKSFTDKQGNQYIACISRDISEKEALIANLHRSNEDLDSFAYVASHDLRAPLNALKTLLGWVASDCEDIMPQESKDNLAMAISRAHRMDNLLTDLLEYSRIGRNKKAPSTFNLKDKIFEWLELVDLPMGFGIQCDNVNVFLPETPINIIMVNLISNAIKHHDSAMANIKIKARLNKHHTVLEIHDDGPGIPDKHKKKVFDLFQTLKSRDEVEASGMGLSVVKKIVHNYGGKIAIKDNSPRGCRFVIHWPNDSE